MAETITENPKLTYSQPSFAGLIGAARRDITPPAGIYVRNWAAVPEGHTTTGTHRPLSTTAMVIRANSSEKPLVLVSLDASWFKVPSDEWEWIRGPVISELGLDVARVIIAYSHTHAGCSLSSNETSKPGGEKILPYFRHIQQQLIEAIREADLACGPAILTWATGRCALAVNRDQVDPEAKRRRLIVGFDPEATADDTVVVGRATAIDGQRVIATVVNYACHPTTLAWQNRLASPDYVGSARALVEANTNGAPCLFAQGASGELAPRSQYTGDTAVAESNGRQLGYAVLSTLESMLKPGTALRYDGIVESGAPLGVWKEREEKSSTTLSATLATIELPLKPRPSEEQLHASIQSSADPMVQERSRRELLISRFVGSGPTCPTQAWIWRIGQALIIVQPNEAYSQLQLSLRRSFPQYAVVVANVANGWCGYLPPRELYKVDTYSVWQTPFAEGALEILIDALQAGATKATLQD